MPYPIATAVFKPLVSKGAVHLKPITASVPFFLASLATDTAA
ncbi:hypothetical protein [Aceticella autotrophica]|nr:hypothetical protein [Aceticella autotrophica]